jgi:hypothetical protein
VTYRRGVHLEDAADNLAAGEHILEDEIKRRGRVSVLLRYFDKRRLRGVKRFPAQKVMESCPGSPGTKPGLSCFVKH